MCREYEIEQRCEMEQSEMMRQDKLKSEFWGKLSCFLEWIQKS